MASDHTPAEVATMDENLAVLNGDIDTIVKTYRRFLVRFDEHEALVRLAAWIGKAPGMERNQLLLMTAVMVRRLAQAGGGS
jgi:hypothetical protein